MKSALLYLSLASMIFLGACGESIKGNGNLAEVKHELTTFHEVDISGMYELELVEGGSALEVITDENLHEHIKFEVNDGALRIHSDDKRLEAETLLLRIHYQDIDEIEISGAAELTAANTVRGDRFEVEVSGACEATLELDVDELEIEISGGGEMNLSGRADRIEISVSGAGEINGDQLKTKTADIDITGAGEVDLEIEESLNVDITGAGEVRYRGNPDVTQSVTGAGSIERKEG